MLRYRLSLVALGATALLAVPCAGARGQAGFAAPAGGGASPTFRQPSGYPGVTGRSNPALDFFGRPAAVAYAPGGRTQPLPAPRPVQTGPAYKPFTSVPQHSSITPYLALEQRESDVGLPNYYLFVRPQLEQQAVNNVQQAQYRRMQQQIRRNAAGGAIVPAGAAGGMPTTGHSSQFMNNGGYYPGLMR